ncbi:hypothetical protein Tco_0521079 [Tanacetum coccineum]
MTKLSMEWKRLCKINAKVRVKTEESAVKPKPELKNTIGCNLNPSDGPGKPNRCGQPTDNSYTITERQAEQKRKLEFNAGNNQGSKVMEIVIPEVGRIEDDILLIKDDTLREKLLNVNRLVAKIKALKDNPVPSSVVVTSKPSSGSPTTPSDLSLPDYEAFSNDHIEETSSGRAENLAVRSICPDWKTQYGKRQVILKEIMIVFLLRRYIGDLSWSSLKPRGLDFANLPRGLATMDPPGDIMRANLTAKRSLTPVLLGPPSIKDAHRFVKKTVILERDIGENGPPGREQKLDEATMGLPHKLTKPPRVYSLQACVWKGCISIEARAHAHTGNYSKQTAI